jgi:hypothetical protein
VCVHKAQPAQRTPVPTVVPNKVVNFYCQALSHLADVSLRLAFITAGAEAHGVWELQQKLVLEHAHVPRVALEAVHEDDDVLAGVLSPPLGTHAVFDGFQTVVLILAAGEGTPTDSSDRGGALGRERSETSTQAPLAKSGKTPQHQREVAIISQYSYSGDIEVLQWC